MSKLISTFKIGFDDETKAEIAALKDSLDAVSNRLKAGNMLPTGGLFPAMQGTAANDAPEFAPEFLELGQWVFEGQDEKWQSAAINSDGRAYLHNMPKSMMYFNHSSYGWCGKCFDRHEMQLIEGFFDLSGFPVGFIERETVNDVDYLSNLDECVPHIDDVVNQNNWFSESVPQITQADMQIIFIKNLSEVLVQRMHSMERFSHDDDAIGVAEFMPWDIVFDRVAKAFGVITNTHTDSTVSAVFFPKRDLGLGNNNFHIASLKGGVTQTITEAQLAAFCASLEACYA